METNKIYWKLIIDKIIQGESILNLTPDFNNERIPWKDALKLGKNGIEVPQVYIDYDDENIDYTDIPAITDQDLAEGKIKWIINAELSLDKEITDWIRRENINVSALATTLIRNFYEELKSLPKNAAL